MFYFFFLILSFLQEEVGSEDEDAKEDQVKITKKNSKEVFQKNRQVLLSLKDHVKCKKAEEKNDKMHS